MLLKARGAGVAVDLVVLLRERRLRSGGFLGANGTYKIVRRLSVAHFREKGCQSRGSSASDGETCSAVVVTAAAQAE